MTWDIPYRWGGPVLAWELRRTARHRWQWLLDFFFLAFCVAQLFLLYTTFLGREADERQARLPGGSMPGWRPRTPLEQLNHDNQARLDFAARHLGRFFP